MMRFSYGAKPQTSSMTDLTSSFLAFPQPEVPGPRGFVHVRLVTAWPLLRPTAIPAIVGDGLIDTSVTDVRYVVGAGRCGLIS